MCDPCDRFVEGSRTWQACTGRWEKSLTETNRVRERFGIPPLDGDEAAAIENAKPVLAGRKAPTIRRVEGSNGAVAPGRGCCGGGAKPERPPRVAHKPRSLITRAVKLAGAAMEHLKDGNAHTVIDDVIFREAACKACPYNSDNTCQLCDCMLQPNRLTQGKIRWRSESCPAGRWFKQTDQRRPLVNPTRSLLFHIFPKLGAEWNWRWHIDQIVRYAPLFNGKICIAISVDRTTADVDFVKRLLREVSVAQWIVVNNTKELAETATHVELLKCVETDDPNAIAFRFHTKGVTKRPGAVEQRWAELIWQTAMDIASVQDSLASHLVCGSMRSREPLVKKVGGQFFYAGSGYWFRLREVFQRDWKHTEQNRWWVEHYPAHLFSFAESACLCHDFAESSVLSQAYFDSEVEKDWLAWRIARGLEAAT